MVLSLAESGLHDYKTTIIYVVELHLGCNSVVCLWNLPHNPVHWGWSDCIRRSCGHMPNAICPFCDLTEEFCSLASKLDAPVSA